MDNRGVSTVVEKLLGLGLVVLYIGVMTTALYGGAVPASQTAVGAELGERTLAEATARIEQAVPPAATRVSATVRVDLPPTIDGAAYEIRVEDASLVLDHPDPQIDGQTRPVLPDRVDSITGQWRSGQETVVTVTGVDGDVDVKLEGD